MQLLKPTNFQSINGLLKDTLIIILVALSLMPSMDVSSVNSILKSQSAKIQSLFKVRQKLSVWQSMLSKTNFGLEYFFSSSLHQSRSHAHMCNRYITPSYWFTLYRSNIGILLGHMSIVQSKAHHIEDKFWQPSILCEWHFLTGFA